ncbi:LPS assembly lipoprotein LptE [Akkermansiaceae bacterium]|nr:LPS assembly lipoprotein LptE [Akkermansiaceae bacterium]
MKSFLLPLFCFIALSSCAGYRLGGQKPNHLTSLKSIYIPLAKSRVIFPRAEVLTTNSVVDSFVNDGTYKIGNASHSDATLFVTLTSLNYRQVRSSRFDSLRSEELEMEVTLGWTLIDPSKPGSPLDQGTSRERSRFFVSKNLQTARADALPDALEGAAQRIVSRLSNGF